MPAEIEPSPITGHDLRRGGVSPRAACRGVGEVAADRHAEPAEMEVEEWAAPKGSYGLSERLVKPERPPAWRRVRMRSAASGEDLVGEGLVPDVPI